MADSLVVTLRGKESSFYFCLKLTRFKEKLHFFLKWKKSDKNDKFQNYLISL